jgi:hypothetical protein
LLDEGLPRGDQLNLKVTDLELAGTVQTLEMACLTHLLNLANLQTKEYRIVIAINIFRMAFSHKLMDASGKILQQKEVKLKDISFLSRAGSVIKIHREAMKNHDFTLVYANIYH